MEIHDVRSTDLFVGSPTRPLQVVRATLAGRGPAVAHGRETARVRADGDRVATPDPVPVTEVEPGGERVVEIPVAVSDGSVEGERRPIVVTAEGGEATSSALGELVVAAPGWTMHMVSHFHYDPVWWNTQAGFTATWDSLPETVRRRRAPAMRTALDLVRAHLEAAREDRDYKFVLAELDYLKPYLDLHPEDRGVLRGLVAEGRVELVGGMYNEPNTNLTSLESTIRNTIYGVGYQRDVLGGDPRTGWMLDVFGHDPSYPSVVADAGLTSSSWARGPFHQWGPLLTVGDSARMQFPSEFEWVAPDGRGLLTSYLAGHYSAGWWLQDLPTLEEAEEKAYELFQDLKKVAATHNVLLPVGADHVIPSRWATEIHRDWNKRYLWPRFVVALPKDFFAAVREEATRSNVTFSPQSRDMNPIYTGKDVSYIDTKQAQRAAETALTDAEKLATLMALLGARYPAEAMDKGWRQLCFNAHHDGITGTESDQVYLDLLGGWREAYELGADVRDRAIAHLASRVDTRGADRAVLVVNTLSRPRTDVATVTATFAAPGPPAVAVRDQAGGAVPAVVGGETRHADGTLAEARFTFVASDVPATGYRTYRLVGAPAPAVVGWRSAEGACVENDRFVVEADPERGGALRRLYDKRAGKELLRPGEVGGELVLYDEYPEHPRLREGPWHLVPTGTRAGSSSVPADVHVETSPAGRRLVASFRLGALTCTQETVLWDGLDRVEVRTHIDGSIGKDRLLRARFPLAVDGARPVYEVGNAVVGRAFGFPDVDAAEHPWTLDNPAYTWVALSSTARVALRSPDGKQTRHAFGVAEIIAPDDTPGVRDLVAALAAQGVTATVSRPDGPRYGSLDVDSNLPDLRVSIGRPEDNTFTARVLSRGAYAARLARRIAEAGRARVWVPPARGRSETWEPGADLRGDRDLPVLVVAGRDREATESAVADLTADLADATVDVDQPGGSGGTPEPLEDYSTAVLNRGTPGAVIEPDGTLHLSLMRASSGWPARMWIDGPRRGAPDGSSFAWQHWSHTFEYALVGGPGDWRDAGFVHAGHAYNHAFETRVTDAHHGSLPPAASLLEVEPAEVVLTALKPRGNPLAAGRPDDRTGDGADGAGVVLRCYETRGRAARARVRCFVPLRHGTLTNVLEESRAPLGTEAGILSLDLGPARTVTAAAVPETAPNADGPLLGPHAEPAQPVYARYWLHNKGPAPLGGLPLGIYVDPQQLDLTGPAQLRVTVSAVAPARGRVELVVPACVDADVPDGLGYHIAGGGHARFDVRLRADPDAPPGAYRLAARVVDDLGQTLEDVALLRVGRPCHPAGGDSADPRADLGADLRVRADTVRLHLSPGGHAQLRVRLANPCPDEVRGEAQLLSPFGSWGLLRPWTRPFAVPGRAETTVAYDVHAPAGARPIRTWALVKVMAFGRVHYSPSIPVVIDGRTAEGGMLADLVRAAPQRRTALPPGPRG